MTTTRRAASSLRRVLTGAFLAWFIAVSVLATQALATIAGLGAVDAQASFSSVGEHVQAAEGGGAEETPTDDGATDPMTPPGDDVPPEVEVDLEHDPWDVCSVLAVPAPSHVIIAFDAAVERATGVHSEAASPPPRA